MTDEKKAIDPTVDVRKEEYSAFPPTEDTRKEAIVEWSEDPFSELDPALTKEPMTAMQAKAVGSGKRTVIVTASAGAGKTSTMVNRVVDFVARKGVPLSSIVMLTFTNKAAEEMKTRLSDTLHAAILEATDPKTREICATTRDPQERARLERVIDPIRCRRLAEAIDDLPLFHCSTIDSFCFKIVKTHFQMLGLSPLVTLADEDAQAREINQAMREMLDGYYHEDPDGYHTLLDDFGGDEEKLSAAIKKVYDYAVTTEDPDGFLTRAEQVTNAPVEESPAMVGFFERVRSEARAALARIRAVARFSRAGRPAWEAREKTERALEAFEQATTLEDIRAAKAIKGSVTSTYSGESEEDLLRYSEVRDVYKTFLGGLSKCTFTSDALAKDKAATESARRETLRLIERARRFKEFYSAVKEEKLFIDFSDVEHYALKLFSDYDLAREIGCRFLLVDECQDLNPLQDRLMQSIVNDNDLFMVGDVKQSIYRFRLSDPLILQNRIEASRGSEDADLIEFSSNFRSCNVIVDFVNTVFSRLMTEEFGGVAYPIADRDGNEQGSGDVRLFFYPKAKEAPLSATDVYSVEAAARAKAAESEEECPEGAWVRDRIRELWHRSYTSTDPRKKASLPIEYSDITILSAKKMAPGNLQERVVDTLRRAGIPVNIGGFVRDRDYSEISAIVDFLRLIESPMNDYAMLSVLRSDMFGFSLDRIAEISLVEGESFSQKAKTLSDAGEADLVAFFSYLDKMRSLSGVLSLYELVSRLIDEKMRLPILRRVDGRKVFGEITSFAEGLNGMDPMPSISEYLPFFDKYYHAREGGEVADANAVNVMTIHASKGLGSPVVFVIGLDDAVIGKADAEESVFADKELTLVKKPSVDGDKSVYVEQFKRKKDKELKEDKLRLLYVALTRARNWLFLSGARPEEVGEKEGAKTLSEWILGAIRDTKFGYVEENPPFLSAETREDAPEDQPKKAVPSLESWRKAWDKKYEHEKATETSIKFTVTAINDKEEEESSAPPAEIRFPEEDRKAKGTAFHTVMEHAPFTLEDETQTAAFLDDLVRGGLIEAADRSSLSPRSVLGAVKGVRALTDGYRDYREKSFLLRLTAREAGIAELDDYVLVQGKIDLLAIRGNEAILVDYKRSGQSNDYLEKKYAKQLDLYAKAVKAGFPKIQTVKKYIFVLGRNEEISLGTS